MTTPEVPQLLDPFDTQVRSDVSSVPLSFFFLATPPCGFEGIRTFNRAVFAAWLASALYKTYGRDKSVFAVTRRDLLDFTAKLLKYNYKRRRDADREAKVYLDKVVASGLMDLDQSDRKVWRVSFADCWDWVIERHRHVRDILQWENWRMVDLVRLHEFVNILPWSTLVPNKRIVHVPEKGSLNPDRWEAKKVTTQTWINYVNEVISENINAHSNGGTDHHPTSTKPYQEPRIKKECQGYSAWKGSPRKLEEDKQGCYDNACERQKELAPSRVSAPKSHSRMAKFQGISRLTQKRRMSKNHVTKTIPQHTNVGGRPFSEAEIEGPNGLRKTIRKKKMPVRIKKRRDNLYELWMDDPNMVLFRKAHRNWVICPLDERLMHGRIKRTKPPLRRGIILFDHPDGQPSIREPFVPRIITPTPVTLASPRWSVQEVEHQLRLQGPSQRRRIRNARHGDFHKPATLRKFRGQSGLVYDTCFAVEPSIEHTVNPRTLRARERREGKKPTARRQDHWKVDKRTPTHTHHSLYQNQLNEEGWSPAKPPLGSTRSVGDDGSGARLREPRSTITPKLEAAASSGYFEDPPLVAVPPGAAGLDIDHPDWVPPFLLLDEGMEDPCSDWVSPCDVGL